MALTKFFSNGNGVSKDHLTKYQRTLATYTLELLPRW